jgi:membrane protein DedA with SNARE-associated domain
MVTDLIGWFADLGPGGLVVVTLLVVFAESAILLDLFVPGEVGLALAGASAAAGDVPLWMVIAAAAVGAVAGDSLGYWIGRRFGRSGIRRWPWARRRLGPRLDRAHAHFERRGGAGVAAARWVGALRAVVPVIAGAAGLRLRSFLAWDVPSAVAWSAAVGTAGYVAGDEVASTVDRLGWAVSALVVAGLVGWYLVRRRVSRASTAP